MKVYFVMKVGRQINGEFFSIKPEKAFTENQKSELESYISAPVSSVEEIQTPDGVVKCVCEKLIFETELNI
jgi:hypothetical protein